jgi:hypothetical protein|tara:strand:+ start:91 stop:351 length:261 start_codon:yes stop_codon:yes gene_type:complete
LNIEFLSNLETQPFIQFNQISMPRAMLDYTKTILQKVSFDVRLFTKELKKAISRLLPNEIEELKIWLHYFIVDKPDLQPTLVLLKA